VLDGAEQFREQRAQQGLFEVVESGDEVAFVGRHRTVDDETTTVGVSHQAAASIGGVGDSDDETMTNSRADRDESVTVTVTVTGAATPRQRRRPESSGDRFPAAVRGDATSPRAPSRMG